MPEYKQSDTRYRAVIIYRKVKPYFDDAYRAQTLEWARKHDAGLDHITYDPPEGYSTWEEHEMAIHLRDDDSVGQTEEFVVGHYDDLKSVRGNVTREKNRHVSDTHLEFIEVKYQRAPLVWEDIEDE